MDKVLININSHVETVDQAKELLDHLEVLNEKYDLLINITIHPDLDLAAYHEPI